MPAPKTKPEEPKKPEVKTDENGAPPAAPDSDAGSKPPEEQPKPPEGQPPEANMVDRAAIAELHRKIGAGELPTREDFLAAGIPEDQVDTAIAQTKLEIDAAGEVKPGSHPRREADNKAVVLVELMLRQQAEFLRLTGHVASPELQAINASLVELRDFFRGEED